MKRHLAGISFVLVAATLLSVTAFAFSVQNPYMDSTHKYVSRWATPNLTYYIDSRGVTGISPAQSQDVLKKAFQQWEDIGCSALTFEFLENTSNQDVLPMTGAKNNKNELVWVSGDTECRNWEFGESVLGVTLPMQDYFTGEIYESDIVFNDCGVDWSVNKNDLDWGEVSFTSVAVHEIGHFFGQQHAWVEDSEHRDSDPPTMAPYVDYYGRGDDLNDDDVLGACYLYPDQDYYSSNKGLYKCGSNYDCPRIVTHNEMGKELYDYDNFDQGRLQCADGYCIGIYGGEPSDSPLGIICQNKVACMGGICTDIGDGKPQCTKECSLSNDLCPSGYHCEESGDGEICLIGNRAGTVGDTCVLGLDCVEGICFTALDDSRTCRIKCSDDDGCADDEYCWGNGPLGGCFPEIVVGLSEVGQACTSSDECESGLCEYSISDGWRCRAACSEPGTCPDGFWCDLMDDACLPGDEPVEETDLIVGEKCDSSEECVSGICLADSDGRFCRAVCSKAGECDEGWHCDLSDATGACLPGAEGTVEPELFETGRECGLNEECRSGLCYAAAGDATSVCHTSCDLEDWFCPDGYICVEQDGLDVGVCILTGDKAGIGGVCEGAGDCISGICIGAAEGYYCSQTCDGRCPDGYLCQQVGASGRFCLADTGTVTGNTGGCSAPANGSGAGAMSWLVLFGIALIIGFCRRVRDPA